MSVISLYSDETWTTGTPNIISEAITETTEQASSRPEIKESLERKRPLPVIINRPASEGPAISGTHPANTAKILPSPKILSNQSAVNFTAVTLADTSAYPPDSMGVVGPTQYIACVNGRIRSFNKATGQPDGVLNASTGSFFGSVLPTGAFTGDPRIRYDRLTNNWFVIMLGIPSGYVPDVLMVAVGHGGTITSSTQWSFFSFQPSAVSPPRANLNDFADFPTLGIGPTALYIGANIFNITTGQYLNSDAFVIPKAPLINGVLTVTAFRNLLDPTTFVGPISPQGVDVYDPLLTEGYFIGVNAAQTGSLILRRIINGSCVPSISSNIPITVLSTTGPLDVPNKGNTQGTSGYLDAVDDRLGTSHVRDGHLYTAHNLGVDANGVSSSTAAITADGCRWYDIDITNPSTPVLKQAGTLYFPGGDATTRRFYWMPSVMTNGLHDLSLGCSTAGAPFYVDAAYANHYFNDALGSLRSPTLYTQSNASYNPPFNRWGDYSNTSLDPTDNMTLWTIQEFVNATNSYGCQVISILAPPPPQSMTCSPAFIPPNNASVNLVINGVSIDGQAFYDPPVDFQKHITITVGDTKINSIVVVSPTQVMVNVSTVGSAAGGKMITVTNPDGQQSIQTNAVFICSQ